MQNLLLLHGALGSKELFENLETRLKDNFDVHSINFSGHGREPVPDVSFSIELFAGDVLSRLGKMKIEKINIFGYSMGGYVGLYLAKHYPEKIDKVFTIATKFKWNEEIALKETKMLDPVKIKEKVPAYAEQLKKRHAPQDWEKILAKTAEMMTNLGKNNALIDEDYSLIEHDVLVSVGDRDRMVTIEETVEVYRKLKNGQLLILPDTPHPLENMSIVRLEYEIVRFFQ
jgi:pimeloyl-ACP methyl ester carboxylesterase